MSRTKLFLLLMFGLFLCSSLALSWFWPDLEWKTNLDQTFQVPSLAHWFGTDGLGRDVFVRTIFGARYSLLLGILSGLIALMIGTTIGMLSGWLGGGWDNLLMRSVEMVQSLPQLVIICLIMMWLGQVTPNFSQSLLGLAIVLSLTNWMSFARLARTLSLRERALPYVESARALGATNWRIVGRHILPNITRPILVLLGANVPHFLLFESSLSFLGVGVQPPRASWGVLIHEGWRNFSAFPYLLILPALTLFLVSLALNYVFHRR